MSDEQFDNSTRRVNPQRPDEIPRRGYERRDAGATGSYRSAAPPPPPGAPPPPPVTPPPVYGEPAPRYGPRPGTPPPPVDRRGKRIPRDSGLYLPWWSLVILIVFVGAAAVGLLVIVMNLSQVSLVSPTPQVVIVTSQIQPTAFVPNLNQPPAATGIAPLVPSATVTLPTFVPSNTPLPGGCLLNQEVVVYGTGVVGLNLRDEPRLAGERLWVAQEGNVMRVVDGPQYFDDIEWCKVENITRQGQVGWASLEYLIAADAVPEDGQ